MKRLVFVALFMILRLAAFGQHSNEWINFSASYYKIPVAKDGLYRLTRAHLMAAGVPLIIDPRTIKIYHRGIEQAIYVEGESDSQLNTNDFVEFYGRRNDGTLDSKLFTSDDAQPHTLYNIYSDTTAYFLTYGGGNGKRATVAPLTAASPAEAFHWDEKLVIYHDEYSSGIDYGDIQLSSFETGEGWTSEAIRQGRTKDFLVNGIMHTVPAAGVPKLEVLFTGRGPFNHNIEVFAGSRLILDSTINEYSSVKFESDLEWTDITSSGQLTLRVSVSGNNALPARVSVGYVRLRYPQAVSFSGSTEKHFILRENSSGVSNVSIHDAPANAVVYDVTDPNNVMRIPTTSSSTLDLVVGSTTSSRTLFAASTFINPPIKRVGFRTINPSGQDYVIISHASLRKPVAGLTDPVKALAEYRSQPQGGSFDTLIVNVDQLYNQFSYGEISPLAIFNFLKYLNTGTLPKYLFLIGKGLDVNYGYHRNPGSFTQFKDLVPSAGFPASDIKYSAVLSGTHAPSVATGRLSASHPAEVAAYFNKLKEFEAQPFDNLRRKNLLHLSGGLYDTEPQEFRSILEGFAVTAESYTLGGNVKAIAKQSTDIEVINVAEEVNRGLNLITMFGHSSPTSADFDIGLVTDPLMGYNNKGKYPALLLNGCLAGSYFLNTSIFAENWINAPDRGAIGVIAHSSFGFASYLRIYSDYFYKVAFGDSTFINRGLGDVQMEVAKRFLAPNPASVTVQSQVQQMVLLGDPAVSLFRAPKPDFAIVPNSVSLSSSDGARLSAFSDSLALRFIVNNFGKAKDKKLKISVTRTLNDNSVKHYDTLINATLYSDTITVSLPGRLDQGFGNNNFSIKVDSDNLIDELSEENNVYEQVFFIPLSGTKNLYPDQFGIVTSTEPTLSFQHTDHLSDEREFILQLDTTKTFTSQFLQEFFIKGKVLAKQKVQLLQDDSLVYYWRTRLKEPQVNENTNFDVSSFTYIYNGPTGWTQRHYGQFEDNVTERLQKNSGSRRIEFRESTTTLDILAFGAGRSETPSVKINGAEYNLYSEENNLVCRTNTINLIAFDKKTTQPYAGVYFDRNELREKFGSAAIVCGREPYVINSFRANEVNQGKGGDLIQYISNIPLGDSVLLYTSGDAGIATWPSNVKAAMAELGVALTQLDAIQPGEPVIILARKGAEAGSATVHRTTASPANEQTISLHESVTGRESRGTMTSSVIGPALKWNDFLVKYGVDNPDDLVNFTIYGLDFLGKSTVLLSDVTHDLSLSSIDPAVYPLLRIEFATQDETFVTAALLNRWMVTFEPAPEGLLMFNGVQDQQVVAEGQAWVGSYSYINISDKAFTDSLTVDYRIDQIRTHASTQRAARIGAPAAGDTTMFSLSFPTHHQAGINDVSVFVNPRVLPENDFDNNFITLVQHVKVLPDTLA
ncbi:MAG TPA: C25 family cysteine peptidase, partial [Chryseosolibacter sp.]